MFDNLLQDHYEPTGQEVWYGTAVSLADPPLSKSTTMNRYKNKVNLIMIDSTRVIEFIRSSQLTIPPEDSDIYYMVDASKRYRPDLISQEVYGNPLLYWVILSCNNMTHPLQMKTGLTLRIPQLSSIVKNKKVL